MKVSEIGLNSCVTVKKSLPGNIKVVALDLQFHVLVHQSTNSVVGFFHVGRHVGVSIDGYKLPEKEIDDLLIQWSYPGDTNKVQWIDVPFKEFEKHLAKTAAWSDHCLINITLNPDKYPKKGLARKKIDEGYFQTGYGRGFKKKPIIYLINNKLYAKDRKGWSVCYDKLEGDLEGYVQVNVIKKASQQGGETFYQCYDSDHIDYVPLNK